MKQTISEKKVYRLADFFNAHWLKYVKNPNKPIEPHHYKAVNALRVCRTEVLGKRVYACSECGEITEVFHSCKHRFCPTCSWKDTLKWAEKAHSRLLGISHRHVVATVPHQLNPLLKKNYRKLSNVLFTASSETLKDWMNAKFKIKPGIMSVMHTFGEQKNYHQHTHMLASWGGINSKNGMVEEISDVYVPFKFLRKKFQIKFENALVELFDKGELKHDFNHRRELLTLLKDINRHSWTFHIEPSMKSTLKVIRYIGRYSKRFCLSERKITDVSGEFISFRYKDYKEKDARKSEKICRLHYRDFFARLLQHVPPPGFQIVRYYGLYGNSSKVPDGYLTKEKIEENDKQVWSNPMFCEHCGQNKLHIYTVFDLRKPQNRTERFNIDRHKHCLVSEPIVA